MLLIIVIILYLFSHMHAPHACITRRCQKEALQPLDWMILSCHVLFFNH